MEKLNGSAYLAAEELEAPLIPLLGKKYEAYGRLYVSRSMRKPLPWAQNTWLEPMSFQFNSISDAAKTLRDIQRNWTLYSFDHHGRARLIQEKLPHVSAKPIAFPGKRPSAPLGAWTLIEPNKIICAASTTSPFPHGEPQFVEDKVSPPSRAYLKLWEAFTIVDRYPMLNESCLDVGAAPGGWTWVLDQLGARVLAVDRTSLDERLMKKPRVKFQKADAFAITPETHPDGFDWIFSDLACFPEKLLEWLSLWLDSGKVKNFVCTLKFQGREHDKIVPSFAKIPGSQLVHLFNNKHELTWIKLEEKPAETEAPSDDAQV